MTQLAGALETRVASSSATANTTTVDVDQMAPVNNYLNNLRILERQCRELHADLRAGKGYSETLWLYGEVKHSYQAIYNTPSWRAIEENLEGTQSSVAEILSQLEGYYGK